MGGGGGIPIISPIVKIVTGIVDVVTDAVGIGPVFNKQPSYSAPVVDYGASQYASTVVAQPVYVPPIASSTLVNYTAETPPNQGTRQQLSPQTDNKLPVVYGNCYLGGAIVDMSITQNNQDIYYVFALSEVTNTEFGGTPDKFTFGKVYFGGKLINFQANGYTVASLLDESTNQTDTTVNGKIEVFLYSNGSNSPYNSDQSAIQVMSRNDLVYKWDGSKLMTNCAFAIVHLKYSQSANLTSIQQTRFQIINPRNKPGDCLLDYMRSERYGAAIPLANIDTASLTKLNTYSSQNFTYTNYEGTTSTQPRFTFNGYINTGAAVMQNIQGMMSCCDALLRYNEITAKWGVVTQTPTFTVAMDLNDSNLTTAITVSPMDTSNTFNITECKFSDGASKDVFDSIIYDLAEIAPDLLYPNEPVNKQSVELPLVNNSVQAQYICNRMLKGAREDLQVRVGMNYTGMQLEAGDIVTLTNANYGWEAKLFRISQMVEVFNEDGSIQVNLILLEFNPTVYDDVNIKQFQPSPNTGLADPNVWGPLPKPYVQNVATSGYKPSFDVFVTTPNAGITQYAELWYSLYPQPTESQLIYYGTTAIAPSGNPYNINQVLPAFNIDSLESGVYYFFSRMHNAMGNSVFSPPSAGFTWNPVWVPDVNGLYNSGYTIDWADVYCARLKGYKVRFHYGLNNDWGSAVPLFGGFLTESIYDGAGLPNSLVTILVKAVDTLGHESVNAATIPFTGRSALNNNIIFSYNFGANGWPGTIENGTRVGDIIVANSTDSFYGDDNQSLYGADNLASFYDESNTLKLVYTTEPIYVDASLSGSLGQIYATTKGKDVLIEYRVPNAESFYGIDDAASFYNVNPDAPLYKQDADFIPMPSTISVEDTFYQFRVTVGAGHEGEIIQLDFLVDAPNLVQVIPNFVVTGGVIPISENFNHVSVIQATLQQNNLGVVSIETDKTNNLQPTITGYNASHTAVSGALADLTIQGY